MCAGRGVLIVTNCTGQVVTSINSLILQNQSDLKSPYRIRISMDVECYIDVAQVTDTAKRFVFWTGNLKSNQRERVEVEVISNLLRGTWNTLRPLIVELLKFVNIAKPARWGWFDFRFSLFVFRYSNWVGKSYFDIQNPILTIALCRKILFWYSKSYFDRISRLSSNVKVGFWMSK